MTAPLTIELDKAGRRLRLVFDDGVTGEIGFDRLRDASPAAGGKPETPSAGVMIEAIDGVGNYAIRPRFSDGHANGIYGWVLLRQLAEEQ